MNSFSLLTTPWLPARFRDGSIGKLAPIDLADDNVVDIAATRPDLQGAAWQFLLGLLQSSCAPKNRDRWEDIWEEGLTSEIVRRAFAPLESTFQFGADSPSFMQDFEPLVGEKVSIATLLPETPGGNTLKNNMDHFVKRGITECFCPHCAALALFSLQLNAPSGGKGYRTGLRGGGPMTTLIELQAYQGNTQTPLWRKLWLNVMPQAESGLSLPEKYDEAIFPWLAPTRTSENGEVTTPAQVNELQAYWGMPRRIRVDFSQTHSGSCDICETQSKELLSVMTVKNYGVNYVGWLHPLTSYRLPKKEDGEKFSVKAQPGGLLWRDWLGLCQENDSETNQEYPAKVVDLFPRHLSGTVTGLWGFGYDFDNMKVRCWYEHHLPLLLTTEMKPSLRQAANIASRMLSKLRTALKEAWFSDTKSARGDFSFIDTDFWHLTQSKFMQFIRNIEQGKDKDEELSRWKTELWLFARNYFDDGVFTSPQEGVDLKRIMMARKKHFTSSAEKQNDKTIRTKKQEAME